MWRRVVLSAVLVVRCGTTTGSTQALVPKETEQLELATLAHRISQDALDVAKMASPASMSCNVYHTYMEVSDQASSASSRISDTQTLLVMYSFISTAKERALAGNLLGEHLASSRRDLEHTVQIINLALGTSELPAGAAVLGTRIKDDIRTALTILERSK